MTDQRGARGTGRASAIPLAAIPVLLWGSSFVAMKVALETVSPWDLVGLRSILGATILLAALAARRNVGIDVRRPGDGARIALLGILGLPVHLALQSWALTQTSAVHSGWLIALNPVFTSILGALFLKESFPALKAVGVALGLAGAATVIAGPDGIGALRLPSTRGDLLILLSSLNWAVYTLIARSLAVRRDPFRLTVRALAIGAGASALAWLALGDPAGLRSAGAESWAAVVFLGIGCTGIGYLAWSAALERLEAGALSSYQFVQPLVTVVVAAWWIGEPTDGSVLAGGALVLAGVSLVQRASRRGEARDSKAGRRRSALRKLFGKERST